MATGEQRDQESLDHHFLPDDNRRDTFTNFTNELQCGCMVRAWFCVAGHFGINSTAVRNCYAKPSPEFPNNFHIQLYQPTGYTSNRVTEKKVGSVPHLRVMKIRSLQMGHSIQEAGWNFAHENRL